MEQPIHPKASEFYLQYMHNWIENPKQNLTAVIAAVLSQKLNPDIIPNFDSATQNQELTLRLALRIRTAAAHISNHTFTWLDTINAICAWPNEYDLKALLELSDSDFLDTVSYMVGYLREAQSGSNPMNTSSGAILTHLCI